MSRALVQAIYAGNLRRVRKALNGADFARLVDDAPPLVHAAERNRAAIVRLLLEHGAAVDARDAYGNTALGATSDLEIASALLAAGADPNAKGEHGCTPLMQAADRDDLDLATTLLAAGARSDAVDDAGDDALGHALRRWYARVPLAAIEAGHGPPPPMVLLLRLRAPPSDVDATLLGDLASLALPEEMSRGHGAAYAVVDAALRGHLDDVRALLAANETGLAIAYARTRAAVAAGAERSAMLALLEAHGAPAALEAEYARRPRMRESVRRHHEHEMERMTVPDAERAAAESSCADRIRAGALGARPETARLEGDRETVLDLAITNGLAHVLCALIDVGVPVDVTRDERTPLVRAAEHRWPDLVAILLEAGARPSPADTFPTPLAAAVTSCDLRTIELLLAAGADPHQRPRIDGGLGPSALHAAQHIQNWLGPQLRERLERAAKTDRVVRAAVRASGRASARPSARAFLGSTVDREWAVGAIRAPLARVLAHVAPHGSIVADALRMPARSSPTQAWALALAGSEWTLLVYDLGPRARHREAERDVARCTRDLACEGLVFGAKDEWSLEPFLDGERSERPTTSERRSDARALDAVDRALRARGLVLPRMTIDDDGAHTTLVVHGVGKSGVREAAVFEVAPRA